MGNAFGMCWTKTTDVGRVEVLVIDNASTDRTSEVAKGFPGVRVAREPSKGPSHARQRGLDEARGAIIGPATDR